MQRVTIVGVGLIGGSFGLALKKQGFGGRITGVGRRPTLDKALAAGAIDQAEEQLEAGVRDADLVYLATPIAVILDLLPRVRSAVRAGALVTDAGSTKSRIASEAAKLFTGDGAVFVGGHPLAGSEKRGVAHADAELFRGATYVLTPHNREQLAAPAVVTFSKWLHGMGAREVVMNADLHDEIVAWTSHLPQLAATALASAVLENTRGEDLLLSAGGLRDTTRLAESSYTVWRDICLTNSENIHDALNAVIQKLEWVRDNLRSRELQQEFEAGLQLRQRLASPIEDK